MQHCDPGESRMSLPSGGPGAYAETGSVRSSRSQPPVVRQTERSRTATPPAHCRAHSTGYRDSSCPPGQYTAWKPPATLPDGNVRLIVPSTATPFVYAVKVTVPAVARTSSDARPNR